MSDDTQSDVHLSPFRRFPWLQLVFCIACLAMAGWLWLAYSYRWDVTDKELAAGERPVGFRTWPGRYVRLRRGPGTSFFRTYSRADAAEDLQSGPVTVWVDDTVHVLLSDEDWEYYENGRDVSEWSGRVVLLDPKRFGQPIVDATASRWVPQTVAGLVVGAMGCFIFGLYLRRWLRERKAEA